MNLIVSNVTYSTFDKLCLKPGTTTVSELKQAIAEQLNVPVHRQSIVFKEYYLNEGHSLEEFGIENGSYITLRIKRSKLKEFATRNVFVIFGCGFLWGLGHYAAHWIIKRFLLDLKNLKKVI